MKKRHLFLIGSIAAIATSIVSTSIAFSAQRDGTGVAATQAGSQSVLEVAQLQTAPARSSPLIDSSQIDQVKPNVGKRVQKASLTRPATSPKVAAKRQMNPIFLPQIVSYSGGERPGTIVIDTKQKFLYLVEAGGQARRYGVGVGKQGFGWRGSQSISRKAQWPTWNPPAAMRERERKKGRILPVSMKGGINNPLGARALYLGSSLYRIHGTNQPWTIGTASSSGCFRMRNEDVTDLYNRVSVGARVVVR